MSLPWDKQRVAESTEVYEVATKFIQANCYQPPPVPGIGFLKCLLLRGKERCDKCLQTSGSLKC
ncbi:hypothetical protein [Tolypothrix sp. PCC 7910]|uniref:hypothetical protein n=1 Tax=Tolypothrix sp. PCC 7910 TaxID=2099387 RepID=UPI001FCCB37F|nr:hypothetical protein [Tolypothrix sp. PCC 7910]